MKNVKLLTIIATCLLVTSIFAVIPAFSVQPPVVEKIYYVGTIGQPKNLDPARAYDTASGEIIQNVYQTLIWYADKHPLNFTAGEGHNLTTSEISDLTEYTPVIATQVPDDTNGGIIRNYTGVGDSLWTFTINPNAQFPSWTAANGTVMAAHNVTVDDVVYSFQRQMVYDSSAAPTWMWYQTAFNPGWYTWDDAFGYTSFDNGTFSVPADEATAAGLIQSWVYGNISQPGKVFFHLLYPFPDAPMYQIFSQTWGSILEKAWVIERGGWDGLFTPGWTNNYRQKPSNDYSELDVYKDPATYGVAYGSKYPGVTGSNHVPDMLGTGPYTYTSWDITTKTWRIDFNPSYWLGFGSAGDKEGNYIQTVISTGIDAWPTRKMLFLNGEYDVAVVPRANMFDLLSSKYNPIEGINLAYNIPALSNDAFFFTMNVSTSSAYQSFVGYPSHTTGAEALFFADEHIRKAFAWAINYTDYINSVFFGEAQQHGSWWVTGLTPTGADDSFLTLRNLNTANMKAELAAAALVDGHNVSVEGFDTTFLYNTGNDLRRIAAEALASAWASIDAKYHVNVIAIDWPTFLGAMVGKKMPGYAIGWTADFADAVDFAGVYMSKSGSFSVFQGPPYPADQNIIEPLISKAATETNVTARENEYKELELRYWTDCISLPLDQPVGRRFARDWVQGWYYNPLYPGLYAYDLYKSGAAVLENVDLDITDTITPIVYYPTVLVYHGEMRIGNGSTAGAKMKYELNVTRADANGNIAVLYLALGLKRTNATGAFEFPNATWTFLGPGGSDSKTLDWYENGKTQVMTADNWTVSGVTNVLTSNALDINATNNQVLDGIVQAKILVGDVQGNGVVDIYDAILLSNAFNKKKGAIGYNADADLKPDGVIDIYDAILLANNFNKRVP